MNLTSLRKLAALLKPSWMPVLVLALLASNANAQNPMAGTNIGQRINPDDARMIARGGWGMAVADTTHPGFKNLASLTYLRHVTIKYTGFGELAKVKSTGSERDVSGVYTPGIQFALPVIKNRLAVTSGFSMNRSSRWESTRDSTWSMAGDSVDGVILESRSGTRFKVPVAVAMRLPRGLSLAAGLNLEFGSTLENVSELFDTDGVDPNLKETKDLYSGNSVTLGALWRPYPRLSMGASWTPGYDLEVDRQIKSVGVTARYDATWTMSLPDE